MGKIQISSSEQTFNWGEFRVLEGRLKTEDLETEDRRQKTLRLEDSGGKLLIKARPETRGPLKSQF